MLPSKITVAGNACPPGFKPIDKPQKEEVRKAYTDENPYFIYLGSIHPRKNIENLLKGFQTFKDHNHRDHKLLLIGRLAWKTNHFRDTLERHKYKEDIIHLEKVLQEDVHKLMGAAEALVYISLFEGFGIPILEAMSCSIPVITSKDSSMSEISAGAALEVNPTQVEEIANAMKQIIEDEVLREQLIIKGKERVDFYSWDKSVATIQNKLIELGNSKIKNELT